MLSARESGWILFRLVMLTEKLPFTGFPLSSFIEIFYDTFSLFSYFISFINKFATDADDLICTLLAFSGFEILFAISHTALI